MLMCCQTKGKEVILNVILKKRNREDDLRNIILEQISFSLWNNSFAGTVPLHSVILLPRVSSRIIRNLRTVWENLLIRNGSRLKNSQRVLAKNSIASKHLFLQNKSQKDHKKKSNTKYWLINCLYSREPRVWWGKIKKVKN